MTDTSVSRRLSSEIFPVASRSLCSWRRSCQASSRRATNALRRAMPHAIANRATMTTTRPQGEGREVLLVTRSMMGSSMATVTKFLSDQGIGGKWRVTRPGPVLSLRLTREGGSRRPLVPDAALEALVRGSWRPAPNQNGGFRRGDSERDQAADERPDGEAAPGRARRLRRRDRSLQNGWPRDLDGRELVHPSRDAVIGGVGPGSGLGEDDVDDVDAFALAGRGRVIDPLARVQVGDLDARLGLREQLRGAVDQNEIGRPRLARGDF